MLSLWASAFVVATIAPAVPRVLSEPEPEARLRWPTVVLSPVVASPLARTYTLAAPPPVVLRIEGIPSSCSLVVKRRFGTGGASADVPLPVARQGASLIVVPPPALDRAEVAPVSSAHDDPPIPVAFVVEVPNECGAVRPRVYRAEQQDDAEGALRVSAAVATLVNELSDVQQAIADAPTAHAHRWQDALADAVVLTRLLARLPGGAASDPPLREALVARARRETPLPEVGYTWHRPVEWPGQARQIPGEPEPFVALAAKAELAVDLGGFERLRLHVRLPLADAETGPAATRLRVSFDDKAPIVVPILSGRDPAASGVTRARTIVVPVPLGARRARVVSLDRDVVIRGERVRLKRHLQDLGGGSNVDSEVGRADDVRRSLTTAFLSAVTGQDETSSAGARGPTAPGVLGGWLTLERAASLREPFALRAALDDVEAQLARVDATDALERAGRAGVQRRVDDLRATLDLGAGDGAAAVRTMVRAAAARTLNDEEASWLADAQAFIPGEVSLGAHALAAIDAALAQRPLDRALVAAHARAFVLAGQWRRVAPGRGEGEIAFLDAVDGPTAAGRARFVEVPAAGVDVEAPVVPAGHLSLVTVLAAAAPELGPRTVMIDGRSVAWLPPTATTETYDLAVAAGRHRVVVTPDGGGRTLVDFASSASERALRRYAEVGSGPLAFQLSEVGVPSVMQLSVRGAVRAPTSLPITMVVDVHASTGPSWKISVALGASTADAASAELSSEWRVTVPVTFVLPLSARTSTVTIGAAPTSGVRLFAGASVRARRAPASTPVASVATPQTTEARRARALMDASEPLLAREVLLGIFESASARSADLEVAAMLWRELDEGSSPLSSAPLSQPRAPGLCLWPQDGAGPPADAVQVLAALAAARAAEATGASAAASAAWSSLVEARPRCAVLRRLAAAARLAADPGPDAATAALVELATAALLDPDDVSVSRALRLARGRTRLSAIPFADRSAGSFVVEAPRGESPAADELEILPWPRGDQRAGVVGKERDLVLSFSVPRATRVALRVSPVELRPRAAEALGGRDLSLAWSRDGAPVETLPCAAQRECTTGAFELAAGTHVLSARLAGGVRPAARVWLDDWGPAPTGFRRAAFVAAGATPPAARPLATRVVSESLAATPATPIALSVHGPVVLRLELRRRAGADAGAARVTVRPRRGATAGAPIFARDVPFSAARDPDVTGPDVGALSPAEIVEVPLPLAGPYAIEIVARTRLVLARVGVWEGVRDEAPEPPPPLVFVSREPAPLVEPLTLDAPPTVRLDDGDVSVGRQDVGSLGAWTAASRASTDPEGAPVQTMTSLHLGATYRRYVETVHAAFKAEAAERLNDRGAPSQALSGSLFFAHPEHHAIRVGADGDLRTQPVDGTRAWSGRGSLLLEPVATLSPGLHLVSKLGAWWSARSLADVSSTSLPAVDPEVFSRYSQSHPRAVALEEGLETEPFVNLVLYGNVRATTNPTFRPNDLDHLSTSFFARALLGHLYVEALGRTTWFLRDANRAQTTRHSWAGLRTFHTLWPSERQLVEIGAVAGYDFGVHAPEIRFNVTWEGSNGRRFTDHSAREGEDFFFAERGPGPGTSRLSVSP